MQLFKKMGLSLTLVFAAACCVGLALWYSSTVVVHPTLTQETLEIANQFRLPGDVSTVATSTMPGALAIKQQIATALADGRTSTEVVQMLLSKYGQGILAVPPARGFGMTVWILPLLIFGMLLLVIWRKLSSSLRLAGRDDLHPDGHGVGEIPSAAADVESGRAASEVDVERRLHDEYL